MTLPVGGASQDSTIYITPSNSFTGAVSLSAQAYLNGAAVAFGISPLSSVTLDGTDTATDTLTMSAPAGTAPGDYIVLVTGTDAHGNTTSCSVEATVQTGSFTLTPDPSWLDVSAGDTVGDASDITVTPMGSFTGSVTLSVAQILDPNGNDVTSTGEIAATFASSGTATSTGITVPSNATDTLTVTASASAPQGDYTVTITGTDSAGNTSTTSVTVEVDAGFNLTATPTSLAISPGGTGTSQLSATTAGTETGSVSLTATVYDASGDTVTDGSVGVTFSANPITIGGSASTATVTVGSGVTLGATYTVDVTGTDAAGNTTTTQLSVEVDAGFNLSANKASGCSFTEV